MNMNHLRIFYAVAEAGSVCAGAKRLHISQPAVTRQLKDFEGSLGTCLFDRLPRGVRTTEAGALLQDYARRIFGLEREVEQAVHEVENLEAGELFIGASTTIGNYLLPTVITVFREHHPNVSISVEITNTEHVEQLLETWTLTLGFIEGPSNHPELRATVFLHDELVPVVSGGHILARRRSLTSNDLTKVPFILRESGSGTRQVVEAKLQEQRIVYTNPLYVGSTEAIKRLVAAGIGVGWLPRLGIANELRLGILVPLPLAELTIYRPLYRIQHSDHRLSNAAEAFIECWIDSV